MVDDVRTPGRSHYLSTSPETCLLHPNVLLKHFKSNTSAFWFLKHHKEENADPQVSSG